MSHQSRREFLEQSMFAAAGAAALSTSIPQLSAAESQSSSPNEKLRVALLGVNGRGQSHLGAYAGRKDTEIVAIVDPDESVGMTKGVGNVYKKTNKKPKYYKDLRKAFEDQDIDVVSIATPNHWHALGAIWAIQAGKDVYCEKPVSHNVSEGRRIVEAARKHNKIVQTGTQCRSQPGLIDAIAFIKAGGIGDVKLARGTCYKRRKSIGPKGNYDVPASVDYDIWLGPAPMAPLTRQRFHYDWHWQTPTGNGDLGNQGIHQMDIARWGLGVDDIGESVQAYGGRLGYVDAGDVANTQVSIHEYGDKRLVFEVRGLETEAYKGSKVGVIFYGTDGYLVIPSYNSATAFNNDGKMIKKFSGSADHFANFIDAVRSRKISDLNADINEGHLSSALCHLGNISYELGEKMPVKELAAELSGDTEALETLGRFRQHLGDNKLSTDDTIVSMGPKLTIDSKAETFTGSRSSEANPKLTREYRKPFVVPTTANL
ncbi:Glucose--fructose oxidoreductase precursor [Gimesia panareensis]|uniref:Glucose--fructose oxidoreductase n=1 Tax=Gimesia panareensis TaxID=2527978 RepID=A0A518FRU4_9PLAN|nr:Gfo/Idh/MocA family oxidoreductase [Gimesia panareensis]QDV19062.1 Glucose--fructose oxidoreductase precursor [Gimesia panareensis]